MPRYRFTVGAFTCIAIEDQHHVVNGDRLLEGVDDDLTAKLRAEGWVNDDPITVAYTCLLVSDGDGWLLFDTGFNNEDSQLFDEIRAEGIALTDISGIVLSHGHADHYLGLSHDDGTPIFPDVPIYMWQGEYDYHVTDAALTAREADDPDRVALLRARLVPLRDQIVTLNTDNNDIMPGVRMIHLPDIPFIIAASTSNRTESTCSLAQTCALFPCTSPTQRCRSGVTMIAPKLPLPAAASYSRPQTSMRPCCSIMQNFRRWVPFVPPTAALHGKQSRSTHSMLRLMLLFWLANRRFELMPAGVQKRCHTDFVHSESGAPWGR